MPTADVEPTRWRRRILRLTLALLLLLVVSAIALPIFGASFARNLLIGRLESTLHARVTLDDLGFGFSGWARLSGFELNDLEGRPVLGLDRADVSLNVVSALRGRYEGELILDGLVAHVRRDAEGRWNLAELPRDGESSPSAGSPGSGSGDELATPPPEVFATCLVKNGRVIVHGAGAETELRNVTFEATLAGALEPAVFHLTADVHGPAGPGGRITLDGSSALVPDASGIRPASVGVELEGLLMEALEPAIALALELEERLPSDTIDLDAKLHLAGDELVIERFELASTMARGKISGTIAGLGATGGQGPSAPQFQGLAGELVYVPDQIAPLLESWLPGKLSGSDEESITFELNGAAEPNLASVLSAASGWATIGLGRFETEGFDTTGEVRLELEGGIAVMLGSLGANGGTLRLKAAADLRGEEDSASWIEVGMDGVRANAELAPLLGHVHPLLAAADVLKASDLGGLIQCNLRLAYDAPLDPAALPKSWAEVPKEHISGSGTLSISEVVLAGSPLLERIASELGANPGTPMALAPVQFTIREGRLVYHEPWQWTIEGAVTTFSGSVGLDETLDLLWSVPITEKVVRRHGFLKPLLGENLEVPLEGTTRKPKLRFEEALSSLAKSALTAGALDQLGAELGGEDLGGIDDLGDVANKVGDLLGGKSKDGEDAATLYDRAGDLWDEDKKQEAGVLYERIRKEFKNSAIYLLHRKKIKKRAKKAP
jgi:hypothetical protein